MKKFKATAAKRGPYSPSNKVLRGLLDEADRLDVSDADKKIDAKDSEEIMEHLERICILLFENNRSTMKSVMRMSAWPKDAGPDPLPGQDRIIEWTMRIKGRAVGPKEGT